MSALAAEREHITANDATDPGLAPENPFVEVPPIARQLIVGFVGIYAALVTVVPIFRAWDGGFGFIAIAICNLLYVGALALPVLFWRSEYGWVHPLVFTSLYTLFNVVIRRTGLFISGMPEHTMLPLLDPDSLHYLFAYGNLVEACAAAAIFLGFHCGPRWHGIAVRSTEPSRRWFFIVMTGAVLVSLAAFYLYIKLFGGVDTHLLNLARGSGSKLGLDGEDEAFGQYVFFIKMAAVVGLIVIARARGALSHPLAWPICAYAITIGYLINGKRSALINCAVLFGIAWILRNRRLPYLRVASLGVACFLLLGVLGLYRWSNWSRTDTVSLDFLSELNVRSLVEVTYAELSSRAGYESTYYPVLAKVPREVEMLWGKTYLEWGLNFVPRALWPDKPRGVDVQAARAFNDVEWGMPAGAAGEAYWNFLLPGVLGVFFVFGSFLRSLGAMVLRNPDSTVAITFYAIALFYFEPTQNGFRATLYAFAPAVLLFFAAGYFRRPSRTLVAS